MEPEGPAVDQLQMVQMPIHPGSVDSTQSIPLRESYADLDSITSDPETPPRYTLEAESEQQEGPAPIDTLIISQHFQSKVIRRKFLGQIL
jgi:hypothetical protein